MLIAIDAAYHGDIGVVGLVEFLDWQSSKPSFVDTILCPGVTEYVPGEFYKRELPCLLAALRSTKRRYVCILIDGYVHFKPPKVKGLGYHLHDCLDYKCVVIGIAKNPLSIACNYFPTFRASSKKPLMVSAIGMDLKKASLLVKNMNGPHRVPKMVGLADRLSKVNPKYSISNLSPTRFIGL